MKTKILFILPSLHAGGAENYALRFIKYCGSSQYNWHVLSPILTRGDLHDNFIEAGCTINYQSIGYFNLIKSIKLYRLIKEESFEVLVNFNGNFGGLSLMIAKLAGVPVRIAWHRRSTDAFGNNPLKKFYNILANRLIRKNATYILSNSKFALDNFYGIYQNGDSRFQVIPNGVDGALFDIPTSKEDSRRVLGLPLETFIVGHVGRYDIAKNHETIFKVIKSLKQKEIDFKFLFCGKNTLSEEFNERLRHYGIEENVITLGIRKDLPLVYKSLDLFYFPSITEGQPNALIEAMISGLPILASDIPPIKESIPDFGLKYLTMSLDVGLATERIMAIYKKNITTDMSLKKWADKKFSNTENFEKFKRLLK